MHCEWEQNKRRIIRTGPGTLACTDRSLMTISIRGALIFTVRVDIYCWNNSRQDDVIFFVIEGRNASTSRVMFKFRGYLLCI